jgi:uncharacterized protein
VLAALREIAPLTAVRGNNDHGAWAQALPEVETLQLGAFALLVLHDLADLPRLRGAARPRIVVTGHSHRPRIEDREGVLYVNPGSAGPRRFNLPITVGELLIDGEAVRARTIEIV